MPVLSRAPRRCRGPEIAAYRKDGSAPNTPGWTVRVVPERDPYFRIEWELAREGVGMFDMITPRGASELIIESPRHDDTLATMDPEQLEARPVDVPGPPRST